MPVPAAVGGAPGAVVVGRHPGGVRVGGVDRDGEGTVDREAGVDRVPGGAAVVAAGEPQADGVGDVRIGRRQGQVAHRQHGRVDGLPGGAAVVAAVDRVEVGGEHPVARGVDGEGPEPFSSPSGSTTDQLAPPSSERKTPPWRAAAKTRRGRSAARAMARTEPPSGPTSRHGAAWAGGATATAAMKARTRTASGTTGARDERCGAMGPPGTTLATCRRPHGCRQSTGSYERPGRAVESALTQSRDRR